MSTARAIAELGAAHDCWVTEPAPKPGSGELTTRVQVVRHALNVVIDLLPDAPMVKIAEVERLLLHVRDPVVDDAGHVALHRAILTALRDVMFVLIDRWEREQALEGRQPVAPAPQAQPVLPTGPFARS